MAKIALVLNILLFCVLINISEQLSHKRDMRTGYYCQNCPHVRVKRAKYYSSPYMRYRKTYKPEFPKGYYSYTPPPNYLSNDGPQIDNDAPPKQFHVKRQKSNLNDDDINNLFKNLSKEDIDKILEFANGKDSPTPNLYPSEQALYYATSVTTERAMNIEFYSADEASMNSHQQYNGQAYIQQPQTTLATMPYAGDINNVFSDPNQNGFQTLFTDEKIMKEEELPKPLNLREEDNYDISYTKHKPVYAKPPSQGSYKLENFGRLPLSDHSSKLTSVSSYNVPHYSVSI